MDSNVLTEQRRETVINLLKGMKIKKTDGDGFDKDDVYLCMQQLCDVYEKSIDDITNSYDEQIAELQDKYQKYDENNELYISLIMEAKKSSNEIISKAKAEVDEILANGKEEIARQEEAIEQAKIAAEQERANLKAATELAKEEASKEKAALATEVQEERERAEAAKQAYRKRIDAMEQEFEEIKTNILRTAGKIDGLKAQTQEEDVDYEWDIKDDENRIDMPESDITVEDTAEPEIPLAFEAMPEMEAEKEAEVVSPEFEAEAPAAAEVAEEDEELNFDELVAKLQNEEFSAGEEAVAAGEPEIELPGAPETIDEIEAQFGAEVEQPQFEEVTDETKLEDLQDLSSEEFTIELPDVEEEKLPEQETPIDEISFEGLEEIFKE